MVRTARASIAVWIVGAAAASSPGRGVSDPGDGLQPFKQEIPKAAVAIDMTPVPGDAARGIRPFWISKTEVTWEAFDVFVYGLDEDPPPGDERPDGKTVESTGASRPDAVTRPSKPYLPPDRGFGHDGFAAITMSHACATAFCTWLSAKSGRTFRLATEDEWELACGPAPTKLTDTAWFADNADAKPHAVAKKAPNKHGLHDMLGNVAEWVDGRDGKPVTKGGSYRDSADQLTPAARQANNKAWNASDPQIPKSRWWLADAPFIGFRVVCEAPREVTPQKDGSQP